MANVATLPGIVTASYAKPDLRLGYGFPIGGVAATDPADGGVISPGGVGFDISCGLRLLAADLDRGEAAVLGILMDQLAAAIPRGTGRGGIWHLTGQDQMKNILIGGARYALEQGYGTERDPGQVSTRAMDRGLHCGSRAAAASYGRANRHVPAHTAREIFARTAGAHLDLVYDVSHNLAKMETHQVHGKPTLLCVHRKGATRALPPGHPDLPTTCAKPASPC